MTVTAGREIHLVRRPSGEPVPEDFALVQAPVAAPSAGQVLVRNDWLSVDPYMRGRMNDVKSYVPPFGLGEPMEGGAVGTVIASADESVPVGATVLHMAGWREYADRRGPRRARDRRRPRPGRRRTSACSAPPG